MQDDSAIASMKLKHVCSGWLGISGRQRSKYEIQQIVDDWVRYLKQELLWGNDDSLFPKTNVIVGEYRVFKSSELQ